MEYSRSVGESYETFEGTPKEIAELINAIDKKPKKLFMGMSPTINPGLINLTPISGPLTQAYLERIRNFGGR